MNIKKVINGKLNSLYIKSVMARKGWSKDYMKTLLIEHITSGKQESLYDFIEGC